MSAHATAPNDAAHVLVVGAGGIGCPAAWALAEAGVGRITLVDPDVVELSNLPRQVLFQPADLGRPKAHVAAERLGEVAPCVRGVHARLDDTNEAALLEGVGVMLDATDGAPTKDWLNQLAVRRDVPLVHAAALRSEARLLTVPAGGRPCLACLFGRLTEETGSCADLGVWNGAVGAIGFLAADAALASLASPERVRTGYTVLDFETGRSMTLRASTDPSCPVCATPGASEPYPDKAGCAAPHDAASSPTDTLDLSEERCPMNLLRARRALAAMPDGDVLEIVLGEEGSLTVPDGVRALGHRVVETEALAAGLRLRVRARASRDASCPGDALDDETLRRFARQIVLPEVGEAGQRRLLAARVVLGGDGAAHETARTYLEAAGVAQVDPWREGGDDDEIDDGIDDGAIVAWSGGRAVPPALREAAPEALVLSREGDAARVRTGWPGARERDDASDALQRAWGTLLADAIERRIVLAAPPARSLALPA